MPECLLASWKAFCLQISRGALRRRRGARRQRAGQQLSAFCVQKSVRLRKRFCAQGIQRAHKFFKCWAKACLYLACMVRANSAALTAKNFALSANGSQALFPEKRLKATSSRFQREKRCHASCFAFRRFPEPSWLKRLAI